MRQVSLIMATLTTPAAVFVVVAVVIVGVMAVVCSNDAVETTVNRGPAVLPREHPTGNTDKHAIVVVFGGFLVFHQLNLRVRPLQFEDNGVAHLAFRFWRFRSVQLLGFGVQVLQLFAFLNIVSLDAEGRINVDVTCIPHFRFQGSHHDIKIRTQVQEFLLLCSQG